MLASAHLCLGQHEQASVALERAFEVRGEAQFYDVELYRQRAALFLARAGGEKVCDSDLQEASDTLEDAIEIATHQGTHVLGFAPPSISAACGSLTINATAGWSS